MPQVTVYIRKDDFEKWKSIPRKAQWVHEHLELGLHGIMNIKVNKDGTLSPINVQQRASFTTGHYATPEEIS